MTTVKLIDSDAYYATQRRSLLLLWVLLIMPTTSIILFTVPNWVMIITALIMASACFFVYRLRKRAEAATESRVLRLSTTEVSVVATEGDQVLEQFAVEELRRVQLHLGNNTSRESWAKYKAILAGKKPNNFLEFTHAGQPYRYEFVIDSFYVQAQLEKLATTWSGGRAEVAAA